MSNNVVDFTINLNGNAVSGSVELKDTIQVFIIKKITGHKTEYGVGNGQPRNGKTSSTKHAQRTYIKRSMSDWIHNPIEKNINQFGNIVADYYGDKMLVCFKTLGTGK